LEQPDVAMQLRQKRDRLDVNTAFTYTTKNQSMKPNGEAVSAGDGLPSTFKRALVHSTKRSAAQGKPSRSIIF